MFEDGGPDQIYLTGALEEPEAARGFLRFVAAGAEARGERGRVRAETTPALREIAAEALEARPAGGEQSNTSIRFGERAILKVFRKLEPGLNPDLELVRHLTAAGFGPVPRWLGSLAYEGPELEATLALVQEYVPDARDGWTDALAHVRADRTYDETALALGRAAAGMHVALARLGAEPLAPADLAAWRAAMRDHAARVLDRVGRDDPALRKLLPAVEETLASLEAIRVPGRKIRVHGDLHLGQVLLARGGRPFILDFEGEPARPIHERRARHAPLRDVAGMLRSFGYAADAALFERARPGTPEWRHLEPRAYAWEARARDAFVRGYFEAAGSSDLVPAGEGDRARMLAVFELDKALYELGYEADNRPDWLRIPRKGIERIAVIGRSA